MDIERCLGECISVAVVLATKKEDIDNATLALETAAADAAASQSAGPPAVDQTPGTTPEPGVEVVGQEPVTVGVTEDAPIEVTAETSEAPDTAESSRGADNALLKSPDRDRERAGSRASSGSDRPPHLPLGPVRRCLMRTHIQPGCHLRR